MRMFCQKSPKTKKKGELIWLQHFSRFIEKGITMKSRTKNQERRVEDQEHRVGNREQRTGFYGCIRSSLSEADSPPSAKRSLFSPLSAKRSFLFLLPLLFFLQNQSLAQDTIRVGKKISYKTEAAFQEHNRKGYTGRYGREHIIFGPNHLREEFCYYVVGKRYCHGTNYRILNDSILVIGDSTASEIPEIWTFKQREKDKYDVHRLAESKYEEGVASRLLPFQHEGTFLTMSADKKDTLWREVWGPYPRKYKGPYGFQYANSVIEGKVYEYDQIETPPRLVNGDSIPTIQIEYLIHTFCEPLYAYDINSMACIITKEGKIKNIELACGEDETAGSRESIKDIIEKIAELGPMTPAIQNGKKVNVRWFISVHIEEAGEFDHPALADSEENRKRYIKRKKGQKE